MKLYIHWILSFGTWPWLPELTFKRTRHFGLFFVCFYFPVYRDSGVRPLSYKLNMHFLIFHVSILRLFTSNRQQNNSYKFTCHHLLNGSQVHIEKMFVRRLMTYICKNPMVSDRLRNENLFIYLFIISFFYLFI